MLHRMVKFCTVAQAVNSWAPETTILHAWSCLCLTDSVKLPIGQVLRRELGDQLIAAGLVGTAMTLSEDV